MLVKVFVASLVLALMCVTGADRNSDLVIAQSRQKPQQKIARYACPMHPEVTSSKRGRCPKCGMSLRLVADDAASATAPASSTASLPTEDANAISSSRIPDIHVLDQNGKRLNF